MPEVQSRSVESEALLQLCLLEQEQPVRLDRLAWIGFASVILNTFVLGVLAFLAAHEGAPPHYETKPVDVSKATPLIFPQELTQKEPNKAEVGKQLRLDDLLPSPEARAQRPVFSPPPATPQPVRPSPAQAPAIEQPPPVIAQSGPPAFGNSPVLPGPATPPPPPSERKPKLAFENPGSNSSSPSPQNVTGRIAPPRASVDEAVRAAVRTGPGGLVVGDTPEESGLGRVLGQIPKPGRQASQVELLSDPMGVDFKPYLIRVLTAVRQNWFAVIPESARFGRQGRVVIQFSIAKNGSVPKLVIATPSGTDAFDRAAVAGISASNPFPPLPAEFRGEIIRLQLVFFYNVSSR